MIEDETKRIIKDFTWNIWEILDGLVDEWKIERSDINAHLWMIFYATPWSFEK